MPGRPHLFIALIVLFAGSGSVCAGPPLSQKWLEVDGLHIFYREAGRPSDPTLVFLHGNPLSSAMYVPVMEALVRSHHVHVIAMDYPSFGFSDAPDSTRYRYTFDHLAMTVAHFLAIRGIVRYGLYMQDYGVPIGFRLITAQPEAVTAVIVQNGVIHLDGFPSAQDPDGELRRHWRSRDPAVDRRRTAYIDSLAYPRANGWADEDNIGADASLSMVAAAQRPGVAQARADLWHDYGSNVAAYSAWQALLGRLHAPLLVIWGTRDRFFTTPGALAYLTQVPAAEVDLIDSTHFATLDAPDIVAPLVGSFLERHGLVSPEPQRSLGGL